MSPTFAYFGKIIYLKICINTCNFKSFIKILALEGASRPSSKLIVNMFSLCTSRIFKILKNLMTIEFWWRQIFEILMIHEPSLGSLDVPQKNWARSVQPFWRLLDTNKQTNKQTDKLCKLWRIFIEKRHNLVLFQPLLIV